MAQIIPGVPPPALTPPQIETLGKIVNAVREVVRLRTELVDQAMAANPKSVQDFLAGKQAAAQALVGQVMKLSRGKADPQLAGKLVAEKLAARKG